MPPAPLGATSSDVLGHLHHHLRLQRPQEMGMVVREMLLNRVEQLLIGTTCELRPALTVGDAALSFTDRGHLACSLRFSLVSPDAPPRMS